MSDIMRPMPFDQLMNWILEEKKNFGSIFGTTKFVSTQNCGREIFGEKIETPFGPAAGPNTQLAQNIIVSYLCGARFFELKTVQIMDGEELSACVNKPCILASDEGYNCEWSTELTVREAQDEYIKAWVACKLLSKELELGSDEGFVFNMSVGYDLAGIKSEKVDSYINTMMDASDSVAFREAIAWAKAHLSRFEKVDEAFVDSISPKISRSITESTLHGCPPQEIEAIASYLMSEKGLNTFVKCNPTLLGYDYARKTLDSLGFDYIAFDDHHFVEDLQWKDAVPMFERLQKMADERGLAFGVKLTNTFPVDVTRSELPSEEMYMSGRSLFTLSLSLAKKLSEQFGGKLRISYSGGADANNIKDLVDAGIWPTTVATTILKPGGYERFSQMAELFVDDETKHFEGTNTSKISELLETALKDKRYQKSVKPIEERHVLGKLPQSDCFIAPCREDCPIKQDIPGYLHAVEQGDFEQALHIILERNALPFITGTLCPHTCTNSCMRNYYEEHVHIREMKLLAANKGFEKVLPSLKKKGELDLKVAIVGGGPAGLSAASFLSRAGADVTVFEKRESLGGIVRHVIPGFRILAEQIDRDIELCQAYGAKFELGVEVKNVAELFDNGFDKVILAIGAWAEGRAPFEADNILDALSFLEAAKKEPESLDLGSDVVVIGAGNTAMDVARAAKRIAGVEKVRLVYRRTKRYMPADAEELEMALEDGVEMLELLAPISWENNVLHCEIMKLGEADSLGRRKPVSTGKFEDVPATAVIAAVGERVLPDIFEASGIELTEKGTPVCKDQFSCSLENVYVIGDAKAGPATVVKAIGDALKLSEKLISYDFSSFEEANIAAEVEEIFARRGELCKNTAANSEEADERCLSCPKVCEACVEVCPNRANIAVVVPGKRQRQIVHIDGMCNECGNCAVFCPYSEGRPYKDKITLFWSKEDFDNSENEGFLKCDEGYLVRYDQQVELFESLDALEALPQDISAIIRATAESYSWMFV